MATDQVGTRKVPGVNVCTFVFRIQMERNCYDLSPDILFLIRLIMIQDDGGNALRRLLFIISSLNRSVKLAVATTHTDTDVGE